MGMLEKNLEREVSNRTTKHHIGGAHVLPSSQPSSSAMPKTENDDGDDDDDDEVEDEEALEPTPLAALDAGYEDNGDDEMMDLGVQMGKMRITDRIGGWIRPKLVDELNDTLNDVKAGKSRWSSGMNGEPVPQSQQVHSASVEGKAKIQASPKSYIGPGPDYIAPASSFFFPGTNMSTSLMDYLPSKTVADQLIAQYYTAVHYVAKIVHRPTMEAQYALFWSNIASGSEPIPSLQAILFAAMFSAAVSLTNEQTMQRLGTTKAALVDSLRSGTEMALSKANFLRTTKVDTMQAFVMYLIPLVRAEVSRAHSALVGTAIRLAECMGLHRDGSHYSMTPIEIHVRRMVWHQLCFLDQRTCEATGPRPQIRKEDYDTKLPANVNDLDFINPNASTEDRPYWTDNTLFRIRAECMEIRRQVWFDIMALDKKKKTLTSVLVRVQKFRNSLESRYFPMLDEKNPLQVFTRHVMALGVNGLYIQVLHRYLFSTTTKMPDRLRQVLIEAGLSQMENAIALETTPSLAPWSWYKGAFNQYHSALLLMVEVYAYPMRKDAPRIWKCLDYIFDIPPHLSPKQKAELVITDLRDRMEIFHQMRRVRATTQMEARVSSLGSASSMRGKGGPDLSSHQYSSEQGPPQQIPLVDSFGQMNQQSILTAPAAPPLIPQAQFQPHPAQQTDTSTPSDSRQNSVTTGLPATAPGSTGAGSDVLMDDIDWVSSSLLSTSPSLPRSANALSRTNGTNTSPSKPTPATSTSRISTSPTSPAAAITPTPLLLSTPPPLTPQLQTPTTPTLNRNPNLNPSPRTTQPSNSNSSNNNNSHQISPTYPSAQCLSSPRLRSTRIRIRIDCLRGTIRVRRERERIELMLMLILILGRRRRERKEGENCRFDVGRVGSTIELVGV
jgi:hypothetical protein